MSAEDEDARAEAWREARRQRRDNRYRLTRMLDGDPIAAASVRAGFLPLAAAIRDWQRAATSPEPLPVEQRANYPQPGEGVEQP